MEDIKTRDEKNAEERRNRIKDLKERPDILPINEFVDNLKKEFAENTAFQGK